eukprot:6507890-Pyramimonas_sp.AAC.1
MQDRLRHPEMHAAELGNRPPTHNAACRHVHSEAAAENRRAEGLLAQMEAERRAAPAQLAQAKGMYPSAYGR